jgi:sec-independent protein translocase protein TatA
MSTLAGGMALITFGIWETLLVVGVLMLLFGARKLPLLARGLGTGIRNFKGELQAPGELGAPDEEEDEVGRNP